MIIIYIILKAGFKHRMQYYSIYALFILGMIRKHEKKFSVSCRTLSLYIISQFIFKQHVRNLYMAGYIKIWWKHGLCRRKPLSSACCMCSLAQHLAASEGIKARPQPR